MNARVGDRARARWQKAIRIVIRRLRLRRIVAAAFAGLSRDGTLFDRVERKNGKLTHRLQLINDHEARALVAAAHGAARRR